MARPTITCPCCGAQFVQLVQAPGSRAQELLQLLATPIMAVIGAWESDWGRDVYRGDKTRYWYVTYGGEVSPYRPFAWEDVAALLEQELLEPAFPGCEDYYSLSAKGRVAVGLPAELPPRSAARRSRHSAQGKEPRHEDWRGRREAGESLESIARSAGVTRQRVHQVVRALPAPKPETGAGDG